MNPYPSKRVILSVVTPGAHELYNGLQARLLQTASAVGLCADAHVDLMAWQQRLPEGSPTMIERPYVFKLYAIKEAIKKGYTTILYLDSSCYFVRPMAPFFDLIEEEGHHFIIGGDRLGNWTNDVALERFGKTRDEAMNMQLLGGTLYGLDMLNPTTARWFDRWCEHEQMGTFDGYYYNSPRIQPSGDGKPHGPCSTDPRCQGHRYDEVVASFLAYEMGMKLTGIGKWFQGDAETVVAKANKDPRAIS